MLVWKIHVWPGLWVHPEYGKRVKKQSAVCRNFLLNIDVILWKLILKYLLSRLSKVLCVIHIYMTTEYLHRYPYCIADENYPSKLYTLSLDYVFLCLQLNLYTHTHARLSLRYANTIHIHQLHLDKYPTLPSLTFLSSYISVYYWYFCPDLLRVFSIWLRHEFRGRLT